MDPTYQERHSKRSRSKASLVISGISDGIRVLDIGCNKGAISKQLLDQNQSISATGIDLDSSILLQPLKLNERFCFIEGSIVDVEIGRPCDITMYFAVHHHIVLHYGLSTALKTLRKIASHTKRTLYFETGKILEGAYWKWQPALRKYFKYDEEHLHCILEALEDYLLTWEIVGFNQIHGVKREILRVDLNDYDARSCNSNIGHHIEIIDSIAPSSIIHSDFGPHVDTPSPLSEIAFVSKNGQPTYFLKHYIYRPMAQYREYILSNALSKDWAINALGYSLDRRYLVFPFIEASKSIASLHSTESYLRCGLTNQLRNIQSILKATYITFPQALMPGRTTTQRLYDVCDFNPRNLLIQHSPSGTIRILVTDFGYHSPRYAWKNDIHFARMNSILSGYRITSLILMLSGYSKTLWNLVSMHFCTRKTRILIRLPTLGNVLWAAAANYIGRFIHEPRQ